MRRIRAFRTRHWILLGAALLVGAPAITTLPGCGGGSSGPQLQLFENLRIDFGNGQTGLLDLSVRGTAITGRLDVANNPAAQVRPRVVVGTPLPFTLPEGSYLITGSFDAPRSFTVTGTVVTLPANFNFTITGTVPTTSSEGSYSFTAKGQTVTGTIPALGSPTATPTGTATSTPIPNTDRITGNIITPFNSNVTAISFDLPLKSSTVRDTTPRIFSAIFEDRSGVLFRSIVFEVRPSLDLAAGQSFSLAGGASAGSISYFEAPNSNPSGGAKNWDSISGTLNITSVQGDIVNFTIANARLQARGTDAATGSFTINNVTGRARRSFGTTG